MIRKVSCNFLYNHMGSGFTSNQDSYLVLCFLSSFKDFFVILVGIIDVTNCGQNLLLIQLLVFVYLITLFFYNFSVGARIMVDVNLATSSSFLKLGG